MADDACTPGRINLSTLEPPIWMPHRGETPPPWPKQFAAHLCAFTDTVAGILTVILGRCTGAAFLFMENRPLFRV